MTVCVCAEGGEHVSTALNPAPACLQLSTGSEEKGPGTGAGAGLTHDLSEAHIRSFTDQGSGLSAELRNRALSAAASYRVSIAVK